MLAYFLLQYGLATARNHGSANLSSPLKDSHDGGLVLGASSGNAALALTHMHVQRFTADESLIDFHFAAELGTEEIVLHRKANPLKHEPCRLLSNANISRNLVTGHAVFAIGEHPRRSEPLIQRDRRILINRSDLDGELT